MGHMAFCAEEYDAKIRQTLPFYDEFYEQVVSILEIWDRKDLSWLDIGCGTGKMYEAAEKRLSIQEFVFMDISEEMLAVAGERFQAGKSRFERMSVLELEDMEKYDVATAIQVHHYLMEEERRLALERCCRALKRGGLFFTFENIAPDSEMGRQLVFDRWKAYQIRNGKSREEADSHMKRYGVDYFPMMGRRKANICEMFKNWNETIIWSCIQDIMGDIYTNLAEDAAMAILGDFAFYAGNPSEELLRFKPERCKKDFIIMVPQNDEWAELIEKCYGDRAKKVTRYAIKKEPDVFDTVKLEQAVLNLPDGYELKVIKEPEYNICRNNSWADDLVSQYRDYDTYKKLGLGVVVLKDGELVAGASSYSTYDKGIEIEIDTREDHRRKGLAYACGAKLILECLKKGLYPSWDAQNKWSVALAEKLGYHFSHEYTAYEIMGY